MFDLIFVHNFRLVPRRRRPLYHIIDIGRLAEKAVKPMGEARNSKRVVALCLESVK